jgi:hypothetical protein
MTFMDPLERISWLTLLCVLIVSAWTTATAQQRILWQGRVRPDQINVYASASLSDRAAITLKQGDVVDVVLQINTMGVGWCQVSFSTQSEPLGYVLCLGLEENGVAPNHLVHSEPVATQSPGTSSTPNLSAATVADSTVLTNKDILDMQKIGLPPEILVAKIKSSKCNFDTSPASLQALKAGGLGDSVILAMVEAPSGRFNVPNASSLPDPTATTPGPPQQQTQDASVGNRQQPRVFLQSASHGNTWDSQRDQSMEMSKDFERNCPGVRVTVNQQLADYTVLLNHIEVGLIFRDNQIQVADKNGDLLTKTKEGGGIKGGVKKVCDVILADWATK